SDTLTSAAGCDSIATLILNVNAVLRDTTTQTICENQLPFSWNGLSLTAAGTYSDTVTSAAGCDSIATLILNVNSVLRDTTTQTICENQLPYSWNGLSLTAAGTYSDTLTSAAGCDSIATLILTVNAVLRDTTTQTICENQLPYSWNGLSLTAAGIYSDTLTNAAGCDSIATLILNVNTVLRDTTIQTICENQLPYSWNGLSLTAAGTYTDTLISAGGCDSIATLILNVNAVLRDTTTQTICENQLPFSWNGLSLAAAGTYSDTLTSAAGCDSIATLILNVTSVLRDTTTQTICENQLPYRWNGLSLTAAGTYSDTLTSAAGCDSIATLILNVTSVLRDTAIQTICENQLPYTWNGLSLTAAGTYSVTLTSAPGCDSIATLILNITSVFRDTTSQTICENQLPFTWNGQTINATGTYTATLVNALGCDSIVTLHFTEAKSPNVMTHPISSCTQGDLTDPAVTAGSDPGLTFTYWTDPAATTPVSNPASVGSGTYYIKGTTTGGCFVIQPVTVTINPTPLFIVTNPAAVCAPATVDLTSPAITAGSDPGLTYTYWMDSGTTIPLSNPSAVGVSGTYYIKATAAGGCTFTKAVQVIVKIKESLQG